MFTKNRKRYISLIMAASMCFCLTGCAKEKFDGETGTKDNASIDTESGVDTGTEMESDTQKPSYIPEETVTLKMFSNVASYEGVQGGWFADVIKEKFNVRLHLAYENDASANLYEGSYDIMISGSCEAEAFVETMKNGYFLDLGSVDRESYMPYISEHLENAFIRYTDAEEAPIYAIRTSTSIPGDAEGVYPAWYLRYDYYEELGNPEIVNMDDWFAVLEQMQKKHPTNDKGEKVYGITYGNESYDGMLLGVSRFVTGYYGYESKGLGFYDWKNNTYYGALAIEEDGSYGPYLQMLQLNHALYKKGILDPDVGNEQDTSGQKMENGQILGAVTGFFGVGSDTKMFPIIPEEANLLQYELPEFNRCISIGAKTAYPELCMAIIDYLYTPEGMLTLLYGPKGECWYYDEEGDTCLTDLGEACYEDRNTKLSEKYSGQSFLEGMPMFNMISYQMLATNTDNGERYDLRYWKNRVSPSVSQTETAWREWSGADSIEKYMQEVKAYYTAPNIESLFLSETELSQQFEAVSNIIVSKSWEAIKATTDEAFEEIVRDMITEAMHAGYKECVEYSENFIKKQLEAQR